MKRVFLIATLAVACSAHATDGVIEINDAKIMANGGYPYTISQPGSYRLTSDLKQTNAAVEVLHIDADGVALDLNGFSITGPNSCTYSAGTPLQCGLVSGADGIVIAGKGVVISNGSVRGVAGIGIRSSVSGFAIDHVVVSECGNTGIAHTNVGDSSARAAPARLSHVVARMNAGQGAQLAMGMVSFSEFSGNDGYGLLIGLGGVVANSLFSGNYLSHDLDAGATTLVTGSNFADANSGTKSANNQSTSAPANSNLCGNTSC